MSEARRRIGGDTPLGEIMRSDVISIQVDEQTSLADTLMKHHFIHHLPVLEGKVLRGIVAQSDLYRNMLSFFFIDTDREQQEFLDDFLDLPSIMTRDPITLGPEDTVRQALDTVLEYRVGSLPIVNARNELLGIVTDYDLMRVLRALAD